MGSGLNRTLLDWLYTRFDYISYLHDSDHDADITQMALDANNALNKLSVTLDLLTVVRSQIQLLEPR